MIFAWLALAMAPAVLSAPPAQPRPPGDASIILARTKTTRTTYSLYGWNRVTLTAGTAEEGWAAEFHSGNLHRVETARDRVVANCKTGKGFGYSVETKKPYEGAWIARTACGIDTNTPFEAVEWQGIVQTAFGPVDRIRIVAGKLVRRYDVSPEGILLGAVFSDNEPGEPRRLLNWAVAVEKTLPGKDIFSRASLRRSVVPERYKRPPAS